MDETLANHGRPWTDEQDAWLWKAIQKKDAKVCASLMQRSQGSIQSRLYRLASNKVQCGEMTLEAASVIIRQDPVRLEEFMVMEKGKLESKSEKKLKQVKEDPYYAVLRGHVPGIYRSWDECKTQLYGYQGTRFKKFKTLDEAEAFMRGRQPMDIDVIDESENANTSCDKDTKNFQCTSDRYIQLSDEQTEVLDVIFERRKSIFLTGPAGTGKTVTLRAVIDKANELHWNVGVTAMTGSASYLIKGQTLHSFLKIGLGKRDPRVMANRTQTYNEKTWYMLKKLDLLIVDEISMLDSELFVKISKYLQNIRDNDLPFGGMQILLCGDMCQLQSVQGDYCFLSKEWDRLGPVQIMLHKIFRQDGDVEFKEMLMELRYGKCSDETLKRLKKCVATKFDNDVIPTRMYSLNKDVDRINKEEFNKLCAHPNTITQKYRAKYTGSKRFASSWTKDAVKKWAESSGILEEIELCKGAQVVVTWNLQEGAIVNGTRGVVHSMDDTSIVIKTIDNNLVDIPITEIPMEDDNTACVKFLPIKLAWAISIHKSQGMTLDCMEVDLGSSIFAYGQAYTALSRARNLASVRITDIKKTSFRTHPAVLSLYGQL